MSLSLFSPADKCRASEAAVARDCFLQNRVFEIVASNIAAQFLPLATGARHPKTAVAESLAQLAKLAAIETETGAGGRCANAHDWPQGFSGKAISFGHAFPVAMRIGV